ncbi:MAG: 30S ribosomal protein S13 [bacterium]|nr:30S ribosomal protein S13 [bacterium]MDP3771654.1 30S ribosomal protein S13 [bacterium]
MARIAGVTLPNDKHIWVALTSIYGIGRSGSLQLLKQVGIEPQRKTRELNDEEVQKLRMLIEKQSRVEGDLRREVFANIKRLKDIGCYRGSRHAKKLPARGQRTKTNSRTVRGNIRRTMGSGRRKLEKT